MVTASSTNVSGTVTEAAGIAGVASGWGRTTSYSAPGVNSVFPIELAVNSNLFGVNTGAPTKTTLTYNGATQNFTGATAFSLDFSSLDHAAQVSITVTDANGSTETASNSFAGPGSDTFAIGSLAFTSNGGEGSFNWGSVTQFAAEIDGQQDLNYTLGFINVTDPAVVPEPSSLAIWVVMVVIGGGVGFGRTWRKRLGTAA